MLRYMSVLKEMPSVKIGKEQITYKSINSWIISEKRNNDSNNKQREAIITAIINGKIPNEYFCKSSRWNLLKISVDNFVRVLFPEIDNNCQVVCKQKGGRKFNYDFEFILKENKIVKKVSHIELKFNASEIDDAPQFASPMKPSQYLSHSFEDYHYSNILPQIIKS